MSDLRPNPPPRTIQNYAFGAILIVLFLLVCRLFAPFFSVLLWSTLLYILLSPLHQRLIRNLDLFTRKGKILKSIWAAIFAVGTMVIIFIPLTFVASVFFRQIMELVRYSRDMFSQEPEMLKNIFEKISVLVKDITAGQIVLDADDIQRQLMAALTSGLQRLVLLSSIVARNVSNFSLSIFLIMFSMFFFYVDGPYLSRVVLRAIPIRREYISALTAKFMDITRNLFFGYIMVALIQSVMAYIIFSIFQVKGSLVFAALTFICVFIPMIGGGLVWLPIGIMRLVSGDAAGGIVFLLVSGLFISLLDNVVRPVFLKDRIQLHPLIIFFAILGGIKVFGFNGLVLGPVLVILFLTVLDMFLTEHKIDEQYTQENQS
jgi:predicted PurR-regulated permease PerM